MVEVYIDGASAGNPGPSGAGIFIKRENGEVNRHTIPLGTMSNHEAEYYALLHALDICIHEGITTVSFRTDSQLIDAAIEKRYVKNQTYKPLLDEALAKIEQLELFFMKWVPSKQNRADELSKRAIQLNQTTE
ncbi:reverse transcriptase-like protein [Desertibacillus haloalkaliphilus]|uniref:reverse transcriptase-like protein n=1 Tax=Desertibacillus haloalkaliphilus TaxID=1328930 RepID=UPI001C2668D5|nr:reverse transcriptase-like protein [Desertibacillus haloalkaliphilus]MBU8906058.1 reverse transcriptase-like protein [Desertibacillus haloalkaliphilus]